MIFLGEQIAEWKCHRPPPPVCLVINYVFFVPAGPVAEGTPWFRLVLDFIQWINKQKVTSQVLSLYLNSKDTDTL